MDPEDKIIADEEEIPTCDYEGLFLEPSDDEIEMETELALMLAKIEKYYGE